MAAMIEILSHAPFGLVFKAVVGFALFAVVLIGAIFFVLGGDFTPTLQVVAGLIGALLGAFGVWWVQASPHY